MSEGSMRKLSVCDIDCARSNHCRVGGIRCKGCGLWYCPDGQDNCMEDGMCDECRAEEAAARREESDEDGNDQ